jgi:phosphate-selective porin OprO and OprP
VARRLVWGAAAGVAWLAAGLANAAEPPAGAGEDQDLRAQVQALKALVQSISTRDQQRIDALTAQVQALQTRLGAASPDAGVTPGAGPAIAKAQGPVLPPQDANARNPNQPPPPPDGQALARAEQNATAHAIVPPIAQVVEGPTFGVPRVIQNSTHRLTLQSGDRQYSIGLTGDIQIDTGDYVSFRPDSRKVGPQDLSSGLNARRARLGIAGTAGPWGFGLVWDAGNSSDATAKGIETAQIVYGGLKGAAFEIGYSNTFFTLDQATSSNDTLFLERATPSNIATNFNTGDARSNAGVRFFGDRYWLGGYVTGPASGDSHTLTGERLGAFQRGAVQVLKGEDYTLHLGFGVDELLAPPNAGNGTPKAVSLSDQPELRLDPTTLLSTGTIGSAAHPATSGYVLDLETAGNWRSLFWQGELYRYQISRRGLADADFGGAYEEVSWTLTGETHTYNPQSASYFRVYPKRPFSLTEGGLGAWEIAARVSYVDLDSDFRTGSALSVQPAAVDGGRQTGYTLGLNWYPNDLFRLLLDYNHIDFAKANGTAAAGAALGIPVGAHSDAVSLRTQVAF